MCFKKNLIVFILVFFFLACKKEVTELPAATQTGANIFGAKVNGKLWIPQGFGPFPANDILEAVLLGNNLRINARNFSSSPNETEFEFYIKDIDGAGTYLLNANSSHPTTIASYAYYVKRSITPLNEWITSSSHTGSFTITKLDTSASIVSGTFQFNALNIYNAPEPLAVTEGRFDIKFTR